MNKPILMQISTILSGLLGQHMKPSTFGISRSKVKVTHTSMKVVQQLTCLT